MARRTNRRLDFARTAAEAVLPQRSDVGGYGRPSGVRDDRRAFERELDGGTGEWRSLLRWNSIRRSKALERISGKRWNTLSRIAG